MKEVDKISLKDMQHRAMQIANRYDEYNRVIGRKGWDAQDFTNGLIGDVGDLMKAMMAVHNRRDVTDAISKVEHELNDILWSILLLYKFFQLEPTESFMKAMDALEPRVIKMKAEAAKVRKKP